MPYKNIRFIKLALELFDDERFLLECNDSQKLDYILWIAMAGLTTNEARDNVAWLKNRFNLQKAPDELSENLTTLLQKFPKMYSVGGKIKFRNFNDYHNPLRSADGTPKESPLYTEYKDKWNAKIPFKIREMSNGRKKHLRERLKEREFANNYDLILDLILKSDFLLGKKPSEKHKYFKADFDWVIGNDTNYIKILEGKYDNTKADFFDQYRKDR